jgi:hypothetical protein
VLLLAVGGTPRAVTGYGPVETRHHLSARATLSLGQRHASPEGFTCPEGLAVSAQQVQATWVAALLAFCSRPPTMTLKSKEQVEQS